ncbi:hypothetical protein JQ574_34125 [Bradyrhizobium sp. AUGA SZCCT0158]|uniref:Os1348 family NHLP clan protein n=1 Tax=Bradyrhizobium sp. AUGA SZCCT0158 TaxID=2807661 RepID=UPI001BAB3281|nr:Os1348 family NHLP clan protein [Bradyrhizobium sp. AUGA SZCCT0158]MBR1201045.1 hypothetical protein [Bradyrhizobium sp. AUGA SZCCT0158]
MAKLDEPISRAGLQEIIGKLLLDPAFQRLFMTDPKFAIQNAGIALTDNEFDALKKMQEDLLTFASSPGVKQLAEHITLYKDRIYQPDVNP